jgi:hypothetical protein
MYGGTSMRAPDDGGEELEPRGLVNLVAVAAVVLLVILSYWAFDALEHSRKFQRCLDSGRSNCVNFVNPDK